MRTLYQTGKLAQLAQEMRRYKMSIVGVSECRSNSFGEITTATGETFLYSGNDDEEDTHRHGGGLLLSKDAAKSLVEWETVSERFRKASFASKGRNISIVQWYAATNSADPEEKETNRPVKNKQGNTKESQQMERWREHFRELLNRPPPDVPPDISESTEDLQVNCGRISKEEIKRAIKKLKLGKAPGFDNMPPDILKADVAATTEFLYGLFNKIWDTEEIPTELKTGLLVQLPKKGNLSECKN